MFEKIASILNRNKEVAEWQITRSSDVSAQLYVTAYEKESERNVEQEIYTVNVLTRKSEPDLIGESAVVIQQGDDIDEKLAAVIQRAGYVKNKAYTFPEPYEDSPPAYKKPEALEETVKRIAGDYEVIKRMEGVKLSYFEIFVTDRETRLENSKGLKTEEQGRSIFTEFVLFSSDERHESYNARKAGNYETLNLLREINLSAEAVRNADRAILPPNGKFNVLFTEEALDTLFNYFVKQANAAALYAGWSVLKQGETVIADVEGDVLTLESDPTIEGLMESSRYDWNGVKREKLRLIDKNVFQNRTAIQKYACYTGVPATGPMGNIVVGRGETSLESMKKEGSVLEVRQFSTFEPNEVTGAFSGEIRCGQLWNMGEITPLKGGSVSGTVADAFKNVRFSREETVRSSYRGPAGVLINGLSVAGE